MTTRLDHLVVAAKTLDAGCAHVVACLGVAPAGGGRHDRMGTHNRLLRIGPSIYLEVIAIDPEAPTPPRPRWFGLDEGRPDAPPGLVAWLVRTEAIETVIAALPGRLASALGPVTPMRRDDLAWSLTIPRDGRCVEGGAVPGVIDWSGAAHPAKRLEDHGLVLESLVIAHPEPAGIRRALAALDFEGPVELTGGDARIEAVVRTRDGVRRLT